MKKVGQVLKDSVMSDEMLDATRAQRALQCWPEVVGEKLAEKCRPDRYTRGTVWVAVSGAAWAQELRMMKDVLLERLRTLSGEENLFTDIRFGVRKLPPIPGEAMAESPVVVERKDLTIREIAAQRLARWKDETGT